MNSFYDWERYLQLLEEAHAKLKKDIMSKDREVARVAIVLHNALCKEEAHVKEILGAVNGT